MPRYLHTKEERAQLERIMAAAFITEKIGYNYKLTHILLKRHNFDISVGFYTNNMTSVVRNVFRRIEQFVDAQCDSKFHPLSNKEFKLLRAPLIQVREWLFPDELQTFYKFVKLTYNLSGDKEVSREKAHKLHGQILLALEKQRREPSHVKQRTVRRLDIEFSFCRMFSKDTGGT